MQFATRFVYVLNVDSNGIEARFQTETFVDATIWLAWQTLRVEELWASLAVISLLGVGFNAALARVGRRLVPWHSTPEI